MRLNWHNAEIRASYGRFPQIPPMTVPEIAFAGRSNVGKSSLINKLLNRRSLARVSSRPGKTVTINYFDIDGQIYIVDLPGYGYAKIAKSEKERFGQLTERYLQSGRISLLVQLIDFRHPPTKDDLLMLDFLNASGTDYVIALTKADKLKKRERERMRLIHGEYGENIIEFSSETGEGTDELRAIIEGVKPC
jgi:GTP-binding protein